MISKPRSLIADTRGATAIEYGLIVALISCGLILSLGSVGGSIGSVLSTAASALSGDEQAAPPKSTPQAVRS